MYNRAGQLDLVVGLMCFTSFLPQVRLARWETAAALGECWLALVPPEQLGLTLFWMTLPPRGGGWVGAASPFPCLEPGDLG